MSSKRFPSALPQHADDFLRDIGQSPRTQAAYRTALVNLQVFAEASELTRQNIPLPPRAWRAETLADFTSLQAMVEHASIETTRGTYAPKTPVDQLTEEIATYGRDPKAVIERARRESK